VTARHGWALVAVLALTAAGALLVPPIPQDPAYHRFADDRALLGVPNALNVLSNLPFTVVGLFGIAALLGSRPVALVDPSERWAYVVFFVGVLLTGLGSAYYHLAPDNDRLVWDRLPMTVAFMALLAAVVAERVGVRAGTRLLGPFVTIGLVSVLQWHLSERAGAGDLRLYALVQFLPLLVVPVLMGLYRARYTRGTDILGVVALYGLAKVFELGDGIVLGLGHLVSGHTLKHLSAAAATWWVLRMLTRRAPAGESVSPGGSRGRP
jgi:predicted membrane channel-forming protein YqfA (hemolysin III family)